MNINTSYLTKNIIAYIGNKRSLLALIQEAITASAGQLTPGWKFLDLFSGSGIVARLAKQLGYEVYANDWEYYSYIINSGMIRTNLSDIDIHFGGEQKFKELLDHINNLPDPEEEEQYIAKYYAPQSFQTEKADFKTERLFYTRQNALAIDKIRNYIEKEYPIGGNETVRHLLLSLLLYQAATHTNTSGVFKACHKGFGGHGGDALKRILAPIQLSVPPLINSHYPVHIYREDANTLVKQLAQEEVDIAYLDPPYNQHQYGSNYHMLNTIAMWDKIPEPLELNEKGALKRKAAIREDWIKTKSDYCYRNSAVSAFSDLLKNLKARHILISYSNDGIIPFEQMKDLCAQKGDISIVTNAYSKYKGGKQSNSRLISNIEFILTINTTQKSSNKGLKNIESVIFRKKIYLLLKQKFSQKKLKAQCEKMEGSRIFFRIKSGFLKLNSRYCFELNPDEQIDNLSLEEMEELHSLLANCICQTKDEELEEILAHIHNDPDENDFFIKLIPNTLQKLAHKKNRTLFQKRLEEIKKLAISHQELYTCIEKKIEDIEKLAENRFRH